MLSQKVKYSQTYIAWNSNGVNPLSDSPVTKHIAVKTVHVLFNCQSSIFPCWMRKDFRYRIDKFISFVSYLPLRWRVSQALCFRRRPPWYKFHVFGHPICYCLLSVNIVAIGCVNQCTFYNERYPKPSWFFVLFIITHFLLCCAIDNAICLACVCPKEYIFFI